jgi:6-methylsalicylate decarboxylase
MFECPHETGRAAIDMLLSDTLSLAQDCEIILSHAGGTLPYLNDRVAGMLPHTPFVVNKITSEIIELAKLFYFDTVLSSNSGVLDLLLKFAKKGHVLFGSDFPNSPNEAIKYYTEQLEGHSSEQVGKKITYENAFALFPRLRK